MSVLWYIGCAVVLGLIWKLAPLLERYIESKVKYYESQTKKD
jgi:hypothetical protein